MFSSISKCFRNCRLFSCCIPKKNKRLLNKTNNKTNNNKNNDSNINVDINDISYLDTIIYKDTKPFIPPIKFGKVIKCYDADTITIAAKLPFDGSPLYRFSVRLAGIDGPEIRGGTKHETEIAIVARDALHKLIFGKIVELRGNGKEKYGRLLADLYLGKLHINKWMIDNGYAIPYDGGKKNRPDDWET